MMIIKKELVVTLICFSLLFGYNTDNAEGKVDAEKLRFKTTTAVRAEKPPVIDGHLNDEVWSTITTNQGSVVH